MALTAEQVVELKKKLKKELARRNGNGSVAEFSGPLYDFNTQPVVGEPIKMEHGKKIIDLLLQICDYKDLRYVVKGDVIPEAFDTELLDLIDKLSAEQCTGLIPELVDKYFPGEKAETSSCNGACTGLCVGSCIGHCNGCVGCAGCGSSCGNDCSANCAAGCVGSCDGSVK